MSIPTASSERRVISQDAAPGAWTCQTATPFSAESDVLQTIADMTDAERSVNTVLSSLHFTASCCAASASSPMVIVGEPGDEALLGATALEGFGLVLDPFRRELRPLQLTLKDVGGVPPRD